MHIFLSRRRNLIRNFRIVLLFDNLAMTSSGWEAVHILFDLISEGVRVPTEKGLGSHDCHRHYRVEFASENFLRA